MQFNSERDKDLLWYMKKYENFNKYLEDIVKHIVPFFGNREIVIEYIDDPEDEEGSILLSILIDDSKSLEEWEEIMTRFEDEWWLDRPDYYLRMFCVDIMPV